MPDHCFKSYNRLVENLIDIEVAFNPDVNGLPLKQFINQSTFDEQMCSYDWPKENPILASTKWGDINKIVGLSISGVPIFSGTSEYGQDTFFPSNSSEK